MTASPMARSALMILVALNGVMFLMEGAVGLAADSMALVADGLDMGADAAVYLLALMAMGAPAARKLRAARFAGRVQLALALLAMLEVGRRALLGSAPEPIPMMGVSVIALGVNLLCLAMLRKHRDGEVHLRAAWIFSATDVQANLGVMAAGWLVLETGSRIPDLTIGAIVCGLVLRGAIRIRRGVAAEEKAG